MLNPRTCRAFYESEVRPILVNPEIPVETRKELVFRYVDVATGLHSERIREVKEREQNLRALVKEINGRARK